MAHGPDPALTRAIRDVIRSLRGQGWSTQDLAERLEVSPPTITRWENGGRAPSLDMLPRFDALLKRPRGEVLRLAGYVEEINGIENVIMIDPELTPEYRRQVLSFYRYCRTQSAAELTQLRK